MAQSIPAPIAAYFAGSNEQDADAALAAFAEAATVVDEGHTHVGTAAIRAWLFDVFAKYGVTATVTDVARNGEVYRVAALVSGNFPGSPAVLHYEFVVEGAGIARLAIG